MMIGDLLQLFCERDSSRFGKPFVRNGWRYFTDGKVLLRSRAAGAEDDARGTKSDPGTIVSGIEDATGWQPWPKFAQCGVCDGTGYTEVTCGLCNGDGKCCHCGTGECPDCHGEGTEEDLCDCRKNRVTVGGAGIAQHYAWLIGCLGDVEFVVSRDGARCLLFRNGEFEGAAAELNERGTYS